jgi:cobalt/nickel transport system permease protein
MHIPDGFINAGTSVGFGIASAGGIGVGLRQAGEALDERRVPLAGLVAAFVFAAQMVNFPVLPGMSGHLLGGVLAAVFVGPWAASVVMAVVLFVQALFFADGGLSALGLNVFNMAFVGVFGGYAVYRVLRRLLPDGPRAVVSAAGIAAAVSVPLSALGFVVQFMMGGAADIQIGTVLWSMLGTHALIGIGEGLLTAMVVGAVVASRPDLVYGPRARVSTAGAVAR